MSDKLADSILRFLENYPSVSIFEITIDTSAPACTPVTSRPLQEF